MTFIEKLERYKETHGVTTAELEVQCGFSNAVISNWLKGRKMPNMTSVQKLAYGTGVRAKYWIDDTIDSDKEYRI